ncbi:MAG: hypothetical protein ABUK01_03260 [Leptospirales bacterium]
MKDGLINWTKHKTKYRIKLTAFCAFVFFIFISSVSGLSGVNTLVWGEEKENFAFTRMSGLETRYGREARGVRLGRLGYPLTYKQQLESLYISFDRQFTDLKAGEILKTDYKLKVFEDSIREAASFEQPAHQFWVAPSEYLFLNNSENTGNFSIYFRIRPYQLKRRMEIIQKVGIFEGRKQGIAAIWEGDKLYFEFINFFWHNGVPVERVRISTRDPFYSTRFQSVMLQYRQSDGSLALYLDGVDQEIHYMTSDFTREGTIMTPRFHRWDRSPLIIGRDYLGALDDMIFSNALLPPRLISGKFEPVRSVGQRFRQQPGIAISKRIQLPTSASTIESLTFKSIEPEGTKIRLYYRYSDIPFSESREGEDEQGGKNPRFIPLPEGGYIDKLGKYIQWKAELFADSAGNTTPVLQKVSLRYSDNPPPIPPNYLAVDKIGAQQVTLIFSRSLEMDVIQKGRYHIYYGLNPYEPLGVLRFKQVKLQNGIQVGIPITDSDKLGPKEYAIDPRNQNRIKITITNEMIRQNFSYFSSRPEMLYEYPLLQRDIPYYFWITACDNAWSESSERTDHESKPSPYVVVRPM